MGEKEEAAFRKLKDLLTSTPILAMPTDDGTYYLDVDACDTGLGAVLIQDQNGAETVIAYASRTLSKPEKNYDVTKKELLAVVYGLKNYKQYLLGRKFVIRTDHQALQWLRKTPEPMGQLARWLTLIEEYDFSIIHRPGKRHGNADALSRRPARVATIGVVGKMHEHTDEQTNQQTAGFPSDCSTSSGSPVSSSNSAMQRMQIQDPEIGSLVQMRLRSAQPPHPIEELTAESEAAKELFSQWGLLEVHNGLVYRRWAPKNGFSPVLQLLVPTAARQDFLTKIHAGLTGGHYGARRTIDQVQRRAYWPHWRRDTRRFVRLCQTCQTYHRGKLPHTAPLQPLFSGGPMERIHIDLTGPHPRSRRGSVYILTCICPFTKWAEAFPIPNKEAATVAKILVEQFVCRYGTPIAILSDKGQEVDGKLMHEICQLLDVDKMHTTSYKPSTNAQIERMHATLNAIMAKSISENHADWDLQLPYVMAAYRASRHEATQMTPNFLMLGREVRAPVDLIYGNPEEEPPKSYDDYVTEVQNRMKRAYDVVRRNLGEAAIRYKRQYDMRVRPRKYNKDDWVWCYNPRHIAGKQEKWRKKFCGPYLVVRTFGPVNVQLQRSKRSKPFNVHIDRVKPYLAEVMPKSWLSDDDTGMDQKLATGEFMKEEEDRMERQEQKADNFTYPSALKPSKESGNNAHGGKYPKRVKFVLGDGAYSLPEDEDNAHRFDSPDESDNERGISRATPSTSGDARVSQNVFHNVRENSSAPGNIGPNPNMMNCEYGKTNVHIFPDSVGSAEHMDNSIHALGRPSVKPLFDRPRRTIRKPLRYSD